MFVTIRNSLISCIILSFSLNNVAALSAEDAKQGEDQQEAELQKLSEAFGHFIGRNLSSPGIEFDLELVIKGIRDGATGKPEPMSEEEYEKLMKTYQAKAYEKISDQNLKASNDFLTENAKKTEIIEIEPGMLQYTVLKEGQGKAVAEGDTPVIDYTGKFLDGNIIDSSEKTGPVPISLDQTIPGFKKGILGMREGEKRKLFIHPDLGFGTSSALPPNALLIFEVEVITANPTIEEDQEETIEGFQSDIDSTIEKSQ